MLLIKLKQIEHVSEKIRGRRCEEAEKRHRCNESAGWHGAVSRVGKQRFLKIATGYWQLCSRRVCSQQFGVASLLCALHRSSLHFSLAASQLLALAVSTRVNAFFSRMQHFLIITFSRWRIRLLLLCNYRLFSGAAYCAGNFADKNVFFLVN